MCARARILFFGSHCWRSMEVDSSRSASAHAIKQMHIQYLFCQTVSDSFSCFFFFLFCFVFALFLRRLFLYDSCLYFIFCRTKRIKQTNKPMVERKREQRKEKMILCTHIISVECYGVCVCVFFFFVGPICTCMTQKRPKIKNERHESDIVLRMGTHTLIHFRICVALTLKFLSKCKSTDYYYLWLLSLLLVLLFVYVYIFLRTHL